jgi:nitrate reductase beta subunit
MNLLCVIEQEIAIDRRIPRDPRFQNLAIVLTEADTAQLRRMIKRPKSLRQYYFARVILNLARGKDAKKIARSFGLSIRGIERMIAEFEAEGLATIRKKEPRSTYPAERFESDLEYVLKKNEELYRGLFL